MIDACRHLGCQTNAEEEECRHHGDQSDGRDSLPWQTSGWSLRHTAAHPSERSAGLLGPASSKTIKEPITAPSAKEENGHPTTAGSAGM
jgi:hypothetical protein